MDEQRRVKAYARAFYDRAMDTYGRRWRDQWGHIPNREWVSLIERYSQSEIDRAWGECTTDNPNHPPSVPEFSRYLPKHSSGDEGGERHGSL